MSLLNPCALGCKVAYSGDWNFFFITVGAEAQISVTLTSSLESTAQAQAFRMRLGEGSCSALREGGSGIEFVDRSVLRANQFGAESLYMASITPQPVLTPLPNDECNDIHQPFRKYVIGVYGAGADVLGVEGLGFTISIEVFPRTLEVGENRIVALLGGTFNSLLLPVEQGKAFTVNAKVLSYSGTGFPNHL